MEVVTMGGETMERASVGNLEELMAKRREREISGCMGCDSEGGLFLLCFLGEEGC